MESYWYAFIGIYETLLPYKPLSTILEAFYWYMEARKTDDILYMKKCNEKVLKLME